MKSSLQKLYGRHRELAGSYPFLCFLGSALLIFQFSVLFFCLFCFLFLFSCFVLFVGFFCFCFCFVLFFYGLFVALFVVVQCLTPNIVCVSGLSVSLDCLSLDCLCLWIVCVSGLSVSLDCPLTIASSVFFKIFFMKNGKNIVKKDRNNILYMYINLCMIY